MGWDEISRFSVERTPKGAIAATVWLHDGTPVYCSGIQHRWLGSVARAREKATGCCVQQLNDELQRHRVGADGTFADERRASRGQREG